MSVNFADLGSYISLLGFLTDYFKTLFTSAQKNRHGTAPQSFGTVPRLPVQRLPPGGSLDTPKILSTGATLHLGPIRLHVENRECRALKSLARCQKFEYRADFFSACKWGLKLDKSTDFKAFFATVLRDIC